MVKNVLFAPLKSLEANKQMRPVAESTHISIYTYHIICGV